MRRPASLGRSLAAVVPLAITASAAAQAPYLVKEITSTRISPDPVSLETAGSFVFFVATDAPGVQGIYRTDGTGTGTIRLATVVPTRAFVDDPYEITRADCAHFAAGCTSQPPIRQPVRALEQRRDGFRHLPHRRPEPRHPGRQPGADDRGGERHLHRRQRAASRP